MNRKNVWAPETKGKPEQKEQKTMWKAASIKHGGERLRGKRKTNGRSHALFKGRHPKRGGGFQEGKTSGGFHMGSDARGKLPEKGRENRDNEPETNGFLHETGTEKNPRECSPGTGRKSRWRIESKPMEGSKGGWEDEKVVEKRFCSEKG